MTVIKKTFGTNLYQVTWLVENEHHGLRLDQFIQIQFPGLSREHIKKKIFNNEVQLADRPVNLRPKTRVHEGDKISFQIQNTTHEDEWWDGKKLTLESKPEIVYEDKDLIAVSKPPYMSVHPTGKHLFNCVTVYFENSCKKNVHSVHRLDRETSGILLLAKNPDTAAKLTHCFENNLVKKCYFFISVINDRYNQEKEFSVQERIAPRARYGPNRVVMDLFPPDSSEGKEALTHFKIIKCHNDYALGLAFPETGRQHQIRVHAMSRGIPLLGDKIYCGSFEMFQRFKDNLANPSDIRTMEIPRHALHALGINFPCPLKRKTLVSPLPLDLLGWLSENFHMGHQQLKSLLEKEVANYFKAFDK